MNLSTLKILNRIPAWLLDLAVTLGAAYLIAATLGIGFLNSPNLATGGDTASHLLYAWLYSNELLFSGHVTPWVPEVFGGLPFLSYYFPMPFVTIAVLSKVMGFAQAFKWGGFLAAMAMPGAVFVAGRRWIGLPWPSALLGGLGALSFLLHEQNSIWGGNLLSILAGEFAYSYGLLFLALSLLAWARATELGRGWLLAAVLEAACGFSHGFPLLVVGFSTVFLLLDCRDVRRTFLQLAYGHTLAFCLLGGWLWPMLEMHSLTIPNDAAFPLSGWQDLLPPALWPILGGGLVGLVSLALPRVRQEWRADQARSARYLVSAAGLSAVGFIAGDQLGLADIRFFPPVWLLGAIVSGWLLGQALTALFSGRQVPGLRSSYPRSVGLAMVVTSALLGQMGWLVQHVNAAPDWGLWNNSGLEAKPQWHNLSQLFPAMRGNLWSPRLAFEHDPDNNDIGSTRALEALPMFINHRPVLEGLYMESAVLGPAIYQLQSEVSELPSSPLVRFPSGSLDPEFAARHMNFLHADTLLLRSDEAKEAIASSGLFEKIAEAAPFALYRVKHFHSHLAEIVTQPIRLLPKKDWMVDAFAWFRTRSRFDAFLPVYGDGITVPDSVKDSPGAVREKQLSRHEMVFETEAVGQPHLIKIAYHPRWQLVTRGTMQIAGPGYMLVVPQEREIRLIYGHTLVGKLGIAASIAAALAGLTVWAWGRLRRSATGFSPREAESRNRLGLLPPMAGWMATAALGVYFGLHAPERAYKNAWEDMRANRYAEASRHFAQAYDLRKPPAKKEEALFWLAKSSELAGNRSEAKSRYRELCDHYHGYWLPESLYTLIKLEREDGRTVEAEPLIRRLREEYPANQWMLKLDNPD